MSSTILALEFGLRAFNLPSTLAYSTTVDGVYSVYSLIKRDFCSIVAFAKSTPFANPSAPAHCITLDNTATPSLRVFCCLR